MSKAVLLDTHIFIWLQTRPERLSAEERDAIDHAPRRLVSIVSLWEIAVLVGLKRIAPSPDMFEPPRGIDLLQLTPPHCQAVSDLPPIHKDPFDRMLVAQAVVEGAAFVTRDRVIGEYFRR